MNELLEKIDRLTEIGIALSAEKNTAKLLELIMMGAKSLTHADGGTLYTVNDGKLTFEIISNDSLSIQMGGTSGKNIEFEPLPVYLDDGSENHKMAVSHCVLTGKTINIDDVYNEESYDFTGARKFDESTNYKTQSILTLPLKNHQQDIIGVLQLINSKDPDSGETTNFNAVDQQLAESLASQAAVTLTQKRLLNELQELFEAFIKMMANAIDDKSPYTGEHCRRIPVLTMMLAEAVSHTEEGPMKKFHLNDDDRYELETAAWLHDCGKVVTPEYVMDKATKLETIFDRIQLIEHRVEIILRDLEIDYLKKCIDFEKQEKSTTELTLLYEKNREQLKNDLAFIQQLNLGEEFMPDESVNRANAIARQKWVNFKGQEIPLLNNDELLNINIRSGTLNDSEREQINHHIDATINMLESLPFPSHLKRVPEFAGGHHEHMDGTGYPKGLNRDEMSIQTRIMAIADIFEALTAADRPYKKGKKVSECLKIMDKMKQDNHIDADLYDIFVKEKIYLQYAREFLHPEQIDDLN